MKPRHPSRPLSSQSLHQALIASAVLAALAMPAAAQGPLQFQELPRMGLPVDNDSTVSVALGDVDGDGDLDMVLGNGRFVGGQNRLYLNNGAGTFTDATASQMPVDNDGTMSVVLGDVDGDGDLDMVAGNVGQNRLYLNDGTGTFTDATASQMPVDNDVICSVGLGDVDGDGDLDMVAGKGGQNRLYLNDGAGTFADATASQMPVDNDSTKSVALGDVDGDGDLDIVTGNDSVVVRLYLNNGSGTFSDGSASQMPVDDDSTTSVALGDVDGDGDLDIVVGNFGYFGGRAEPNRLYLNDGAGTFTTGQMLSARFTNSVALGDVDGDGDLDIVTGNDYWLSAQDGLYLNDGTGRFSDVTASQMPLVSDSTGSVALGDVDGDGDLDIVIGNGMLTGSTGEQNRLYLNLQRQLHAPAAPQIGQPYQLDLYSRYGPSNPLGIAVLSPASATIPSAFGNLGVDLTSAVTLPFTPIPQPAGLALVSFTIPNFPVFVGTDVFSQALIVDVNNLTGRLTNVTSDVIQ